MIHACEQTQHVKHALLPQARREEVAAAAPLHFAMGKHECHLQLVELPLRIEELSNKTASLSAARLAMQRDPQMQRGRHVTTT